MEFLWVLLGAILGLVLAGGIALFIGIKIVDKLGK